MLLYNKLIKRHDIRDLQSKIINRLSKNKLKIGNKLQITEARILNVIERILSEGEACEFCDNLYPIIDLQIIEGYKLCSNCIADNYSICDSCGDYVYNDSLYVLYDCQVYCQDCYFIEKQTLYDKHIIKNKKLKALSRLLNIKNRNKNKYPDELSRYYFKIDKHLFSIERYANNSFRLGSFGANAWIDIGNKYNSLLRAIDYNLDINRCKLIDISI